MNAVFLGAFGVFLYQKSGTEDTDNVGQIVDFL